jgi:hypothetical protein
VCLVYTSSFLDSPRKSPWGTTQRDQKEGLEFNEIEYNEIDSYCKKQSIEWFASAWDIQSLIFLKKYNLKYNKIASAMIVDRNFLEKVAEEKKHTFISTGMSTIQNIDDAVNIFKKYSCPFELMHCVSTYPMKPEDANLLTIQKLKEVVSEIDILFIDGNHNYNYVINDFNNYKDFVKKGGYIIFDDYIDFQYSPEVHSAVNYVVENLLHDEYEIIGSLVYEQIKETNIPNFPSSNEFILRKK